METGSGGGSRFRVRGDGEFDRSEFMEALLHLARHKFNKMYENNGAVQLEHLLTDFVSKHAKLLVPNEFRARRQARTAPTSFWTTLKCSGSSLIGMLTGEPLRWIVALSWRYSAMWE